MKTYRLWAMAASSLVLTACATSLETRPPADIASRAYRAADAYTGLEQVKLPSITPFEWGSNVRGTAQLQTAESYEGQSGGAWLDVALFYATPGDAPDQMRVYNKVRWAGGEAANLADFSAAVQDCADRVESYGNGGYYGRSGFGYGGGYGFGNRGRHDPRPKPRPRPRPDQPDLPTGDPTGVDPDPTPPTPPIDPTAVDWRPTIEDDPRGVIRPRMRARTVPRSAPNPSTNTRPRSTPRSAPRSTPRPAPTSRPKPVSRKSDPTAINPRRGRMNFQNETLAANSGSVETTTTKHRPYGSVRSGFGRHNGYRYNRGHYGVGMGYGAPQYVITSQCSRREKLRVFVPKEKLRSAEQYGLTLYIRGQSGDERPLTLTPNYVLAYQMASGAATPVNMAGFSR